MVMTHGSGLVPCLAAALWGGCLLLSMAGWGAAVNRLLVPEVQADWGWRAAWGFVFSACAGGVIEFAGIISRPLILVLTAAGWLLLVLFGRGGAASGARLPGQADESRGRAAAAAGLAVCLLLAVRYVGSLHGNPEFPDGFSRHDDYQAYLVFPAKMLQAGSLGMDPFSLRRISASLGGQSFLQTYVLAALPAGRLNLLDMGLGPVLVVGVLVGYLRQRKAAGLAAALVALAFALMWTPSGNVSSHCMPLALLLSLYRVLADLAPKGGYARAVLVALHVAGIASMKSTLIPAVVAMVAAWFVLDLVAHRPRFRPAELGATFLLSTLLATPWMLDMYRTCGTPLYPLLGKGYASFAEGNFAEPYGPTSLAAMLRELPGVILTVALLMALLGGTLELGRWRERGARLALLFSALVGTAATLIATNGFSPYRFVYSVILAPVLVELVHVVSPDGKGRWYRRRALAASLAVAALLWDSRSHTAAMYRHSARNALEALRGDDPEWTAVTGRYRALQASIPQGVLVLARLEQPFLLDFHRNPIYIIDWPGGASLPPGMPLSSGEALSAYLLSHSIQYIAYDYAAEAGFSRAKFGRRLKVLDNEFVRISANLAFTFQDELADLGNTRRRIFDDGQAFVLDLAERR